MLLDKTELKSNRRILVFLNMSRQGPALVSSVAVHKELLYVYSRGVSPSFFFYSADLWSKVLEPGGISHSESRRISQFESDRNDQ